MLPLQKWVIQVITEHSGKKDLKGTCLVFLDRRKIADFYVESSHEERLNISNAELHLMLNFLFVGFYTWDSFTIVPEQSCVETRRLLGFFNMHMLESLNTRAQNSVMSLRYLWVSNFLSFRNQQLLTNFASHCSLAVENMHRHDFSEVL